MLNFRKPALWLIIAAVVLCLAAAVMFFTVPKSDEKATSGSDDPSSPTDAAPYEAGEFSGTYRFGSDMAYCSPLSSYRPDYDTETVFVLDIDGRRFSVINPYEMEKIISSPDWQERSLSAEEFLGLFGTGMNEPNFSMQFKALVSLSEPIIEYSPGGYYRLYIIGGRLWLAGGRDDRNDGLGQIWWMNDIVPAGGNDAYGLLFPDFPEDAKEQLYGGEAMIRLINSCRERNGLPQHATGGDALSHAADLRCSEITERFSHRRSDGSSFSTALDECGVQYAACNELLCCGQFSAAWAVGDLLGVPEKEALLLSSDYDTVAVSVKVIGEGETAEVFWAIEFIKSA